MNNESAIPAENVISVERISAEFAQIYGQQIGKLLMEKINLEMAANGLRSQVINLTNKVQALEAEIAGLKGAALEAVPVENGNLQTERDGV